MENNFFLLTFCVIRRGCAEFFKSVVLNLQETTVIDGKEAIITKNTLKTVKITFKVDLLHVQERDVPKNTTFVLTQDSLSVDVGYLTMWREGRLAIGGLLGESAAKI